MPILSDDDSMETHQTGVGGFQFSATKIGNLGATEYTLFGLAVDRSGSLTGFAAELEACVKSVIESCQHSPRADNLMARVLAFSTKAEEIHGFRPLTDCHPKLYDGSTHTGGSTCLYDTTVDLVESVGAYGKQLLSQDYATNGIVVIVTDGIDECSTLGVKQVKEAFARALQSECLESLASILIGVNVTNTTVSNYLKRFKDEAGFAQYVEAKDASPKTLAKLAGFISKSVSSQSQSVGSKAPSQPLNVTF
jgi:hypothetical protein